jgi:hypothetical protein
VKYWWAYGTNRLTGKPGIAGWYRDEIQARQEAPQRLTGFISYYELDTKDYRRARLEINYILAGQTTKGGE